MYALVAALLVVQVKEVGMANALYAMLSSQTVFSSSIQEIVPTAASLPS